MCGLCRLHRCGLFPAVKLSDILAGKSRLKPRHGYPFRVYRSGWVLSLNLVENTGDF
jgi:hypothetical protein